MELEDKFEFYLFRYESCEHSGANLVISGFSISGRDSFKVVMVLLPHSPRSRWTQRVRVALQTSIPNSLV